MKLSYVLAAVALAAASVAACQPQPATTEPQAEPQGVEVATTAPSTEAPSIAVASACPVIAHRRWEATFTTRQGGASTLTVSGQIDLPRPGYSVSLVRDPNEASAAEPHLSLLLTPPAQPVSAAVTAHPVYYFAPASGQTSVVHIVCEGAPLADINVVTGQ